jgi:hypothetical protein
MLSSNLLIRGIMKTCKPSIKNSASVLPPTRLSAQATLSCTKVAKFYSTDFPEFTEIIKILPWLGPFLRR